MPKLMEAPPYTPVEAVTEMLHGIPITDPYRWLEDQQSPRVREWIRAQTEFARSYLDAIPGHSSVRERIREFLDSDTYDSIQKAGTRYFFRKRTMGLEQPGIYMRDGEEGEDQLVVDPSQHGTGRFTAVIPRIVSTEGQLLLYEIKNGGERYGTFALLDANRRTTLPDMLPHGHLRGFAFAPDCKSFYFVHEPVIADRQVRRAAYHHILGTKNADDREIFSAGDDQKIRLVLTSGEKYLALFVYRFLESILTDVYLKSFEVADPPEPFLQAIDYRVTFLRMGESLLAVTNKDATNRRIVQIGQRGKGREEWIDIVPECDRRIETALATQNRIFVLYAKEMVRQIVVFDLSGRIVHTMPIPQNETVRILGNGYSQNDEILLEKESFNKPPEFSRYNGKKHVRIRWAKNCPRLDATDYASSLVSYPSKDGMTIPMYLVGRRAVLDRFDNPTVMTSYGGFGVSMTPKFSVLVSFLIELGCLFALPGIRGGSEFGVAWHQAAKRRNRQTAYDDFLSAAEWLIQTGRTARGRLAIFGGSNSGLLAGVALTQRPDLFSAVLCIAPMLDMLRYHLFDGAHVWKDEFGTAESPDDFAALIKYSPYHQVRHGVAYPATMIVSGDSDGNCNPLHARKMTARLQAANVSGHAIILDYSHFRGHSPVLPLSDRIEALTDRLAFFCHELQLPV